MRHRAREQTDDARLGRILHIDDVARVPRLAAVGFEALGYRDDEILKPRITRRARIDGHDVVIGNAADGFERMRHLAKNLGVADVGEVVDIHPEMSPTAVADGAAILDPDRHDARRPVAGP